MKTGILTFVNAMNFGAVLQAYATQRFLNNNDKNASLIDYTPTPKSANASSPQKRSRISNRLSQILHPIKTINSLVRKNRFLKYRSSYLKLSPTKYVGEIEKIKEDYDVIIAGSDQIWNTDLSGESKSFFLDFETTAKKAGYAVSVGKKDFSLKEKEMMHKYAKTFDKLSVREKSLEDYLKNNEGVECSCVCDPVFLLNKNEWNELAIEPSCKDYIFVYAMEINKKLIDTVNEIKKQTKKKVYYIYAGGNKSADKINGTQIKNAGPREFLGLIKNSDILITNSFHGVAFRLIFGGRLIAVEHSKRNERLLQILSLCDAENKIVSLNENNNLQNYIISADNDFEKLNSLIYQSKKYLLELY